MPLIGAGGAEAETSTVSSTTLAVVVEAAAAVEADRFAAALSSSLVAPDEPFFRKSGRPFLNMAVQGVCGLRVWVVGGWGLMMLIWSLIGWRRWRGW